MDMRITWDENKRKANIEKHGVDFAELAPAFQDIMLSWLDTRFDYGEDRIVSIGRVGVRILCIVHTDGLNGDIRIISARRANKHEQKEYYARI